jgi:arsenate reductase
MTTIYGIKNCDTVKKARRWLEANGVDYRFHDVRSEGLEQSDLKTWMKSLDWEALLNRRGTSWRQLPESTRQNINQASAVKIMLENPAIIKRPVLEFNNKLYLGFSSESYQDIFQTESA